MRKKKLEKMKQELKEEVIKEINLKAGTEEKNDKYIPTPVLYHSKEELHSIQKSFLYIFLFSSAVLLIVIIILVVNPFSPKKEELKKEPPKEEIIDMKRLSLKDFKEGVIPNQNQFLLELVDRFSFEDVDYYYYDSTYLYSKDELNIKDMDINYLLFLMTKTSDFKDYVKSTDFLTKTEICKKDGSIRIPKEEVNKVLLKNFGIIPNVNENFLYHHYIDGNYSTSVLFIYSDNYYVSTCDISNKEINYEKIAVPVLDNAYKKDDEIHIKMEVAFMTRDKVYADYLLSHEISNDIYEDRLNYIKKADGYEYIFKEGENNYYLDRIMKVTK